MKGKKPTCTLLVAIFVMLILSMATVRVGAVLQPKLFVDPPTYTAALPGEVFTINISIANVTGLSGFDFKLDYNTTLLDALPPIILGPFPNDPQFVIPPEINETEGYIRVSVDCSPSDGNGTLATITFNATYAGPASCTLHLYDTVLIDMIGDPIDHDVEDGNYNFMILGLTVATDKMTYQPGENVKIHGNLTSPCQGLVALEVDDPTWWSKEVVRTLQIGPAPPPGNITIVDVIPCEGPPFYNPKDSFEIGDTAYFRMTVRNDGTERKSVTMTINAYDGNIVSLPSVPTTKVSVDPGTQATFIPGIYIPTWAYNGTGMVYANAFTDLPRDGGFPYCPEKSATFNITGGGGGGGGGAGAPETQGSGNNSTAGNYSLTFKLPPDPVTGLYRVYAVSSYKAQPITNNTLFGVNVIVVPNHYPTIQGAVNAASPTNNSILVLPETYNEHVTINKSVTLVGVDPSTTIINGSGTGTVVTVAAGNVEIIGFTIQNSGYSSPDSGILLQNSSGSTIQGNIITLNEYGIYLNHSSDNNKILDNTLSSNNYGIYLNNSTDTTLKGNNLICNKYNFGIFGNSTSDFTHDIDTSNTVDGKPIIYWINQQNKPVPSNAGYVAIVNSANIAVRELNLTKNGQGVLFAFTNNSLIERVNTLNNEYGIYLVHSYSNTIVGSTVSNNTVGIYQSYSNQNIICHNNFINNTDQVEFYQSSNTWNDSASKGNYWSDYNGTDLDPPDGVGDDYLPWQGIDWYPLMNPWILVHDIAITNVTASDFFYGLTEVYPGWKINVTVTVKNKGDFTETFNVTAYYANATVNIAIDTKNFTLRPLAETTPTLIWNTIGIALGNYNISAEAAVVLGENDTANNILTDGMIEVVLYGDVNGDGEVDIGDVKKVKLAYSGFIEEPRADVNGDGAVDIGDVKKIKLIFSGFLV